MTWFFWYRDVDNATRKRNQKVIGKFFGMYWTLMSYNFVLSCTYCILRYFMNFFIPLCTFISYHLIGVALRRTVTKARLAIRHMSVTLDWIVQLQQDEIEPLKSVVYPANFARLSYAIIFLPIHITKLHCTIFFSIYCTYLPTSTYWTLGWKKSRKNDL